jgi:hypothetical protein
MTTRQAVQPAPFVVFCDTAVCDGCGREAALYTDGMLGFAESNEQTALTLLRDREHVSADCPVCAKTRGEGRYTWDLSAPGTWTTDEYARTMIAWATKMETA